jgi:hypothetical protein
MTPLHRRTAERFEALLEGSAPETALDERTTELLELVGALRDVPAAQPRADFSASLREQLMAAAETELVPATTSPDLARKLTVAPRTKARHERKLGVAIGAFAIVGASTGMAVAAQGTVPGDALYPIKQVIERTTTGFHTSDQAKGENLLAHATGRLDEVTTLTQRSDPDAELVSDTLAAFTDQAQQGAGLLISDYRENGHEASITALRTFTQQSVTTLAGLEGSVPEGAHDALIAAAKAMFAIDGQAESACPTCEAQGLTELPPNLLAGSATDAQKAADELAKPGKVKGRGQSRQPSGLNPPTNPVKVNPGVIPTGGASATPGPGSVPLPNPTTGTGTGTGNPNGGSSHGVVPSTGVTASGPVASATASAGTVSGTVGEVVQGVLDTVNGVLGGLTGTLTGTVPTQGTGNGTGTGGLLGGGQ